MLRLLPSKLIHRYLASVASFAVATIQKQRLPWLMYEVSAVLAPRFTLIGSFVTGNNDCYACLGCRLRHCLSDLLQLFDVDAI